ncbi:MAG: acyl-CoA reductase [Aquirufa sp.]
MPQERFLSLIKALHQYFSDSSNEEKIELFIEKAKNENAWFSDYLIRNAMKAIDEQFLNMQVWVNFFEKYPQNSMTSKRIGLILSGNLPAVGMHDLLMILAAGHQVVVKLSSQDQALMKLYIEAIKSIDSQFIIESVDRLSAVDAVIATGSDFSSGYFSNYFAKIPHIIRKNRSSVAVLTGNENEADFEALADDIFTYYGLGCRNVSTIAVPTNFDLTPLFDVLTKVDWVLEHTKYSNNYQYHKTLLLLNQIPHFDLGNLIVTENEQLVSPVGVLHVHRYETENDLSAWLSQHTDKIQCVVGPNSIPFGRAQMPALDDFADGVNTYEFLVNLS